MNIDFIADTNFLVYVHEGNEFVLPFLKYEFGISFISEVELLGFKGLSQIQENKLNELIEDCHTIQWNNKIKNITISLRKGYHIKLPDAIIAATCIV
jgi:predicted nucleic acid-binding protein